ncbi:outer membrane receptor protein involved in Fe transport [Blastomonas natatoria]|uniref:Outer membrane receptor protein involved in Fe transport n=1 Tax=Blastomonas natatoria TaxID=34015 RepID=A0A2V3V6J4_9SPHN|nr:TonB-dependent receptor [Blastomonas natatoria]PXW76348.1 outer membrane receptor protein involved in Fe transport [Blastomonas natatoria]
MPMRFGKASRVSLMLSAGLVAMASPALAQDTDQEGINDSNTIVVVAQGREQLLSDVPVAVSAVNAETLENTGANDIRQLNQVVPSLLVSSTGNEANGSARIRGIGTVGDNPGLESSVAVFIDGVYRSRSGIGLNELGELDRVEVLRGPQGTLFGRNASAGILSIYSKKPEFEFGGFGEATYGNFDNIRLQAGLTGPLSETLAARFDGVYEKRDGFLRDVNNNVDLGNRDRYFVKGQLLWEPVDAVSFRFIADYTNRDERCCGAVYLGRDFNPLIGDLNNPAVPLSVAGFPPANGNNIINVLRDLGQPIGSFNDPFSRQTFVTRGRNYNGQTRDGGVSLEVNWDMGGATLTSITGYRYYKNSQASDTDYSAVDILYRADDDDAQFRQFKTFTQELRLQGEAFDGKLDWLVGGYFADEDLTVRDNLRFGTQYGRFAACRLISGGSLAGLYSPTSTGCISGPGRAAVLAANGGLGQFGAATPLILGSLDRLDGISDRGSISDRYFQNSRNYAFFTHNIFHITDKLDLTLGLRYTNERKRFNATFSNDNVACQQNQAALTGLLAPTVDTNGDGRPDFAPLGALAGGIIGLSCQGNSTAELNGVSIRDRRSENEFTGTAVLSWKPTDDLLLYGSYSRGYKAGGFNLDRSALKGPIVAPLGTGVPTTTFAAVGGAQALVRNLQFDQEIVDAFELGAKYSSGPLTINLALFRQQFENFQLNTFNGTVFLVQTVNGCSTNLNGGDRDLSAATGGCAPGDVTYGVVAQGVELEASIRPSRNFTVNGGVTYADTSYRNNLVGNRTGAPLDPALRKLPGDNLSNAPELTLTGSMAWTPDIGDSGLSGLVYVDSRVTDAFNTGSDLFPQKEQPSFVVVNARVGVRGPDQAWAIELWAQNLFNEDFTQVAFNSPFQAGGAGGPFVDPQFPGGRQIFSAFLGEPRTYGITLRGRF